MIETPLTLPNGVTLKNRIVKAAMSEALANTDNDVTDALISVYRDWAEGGAGLIVTGHTAIDRLHLEHARNLVVDDRSNVAKLAALASAATRNGARTLLQICHAGRQTPAHVNPSPTSISDVPLDVAGYAAPRAADAADLDEIAGNFVRAARIAEAAGFSGVEVHAAHGYLLSASLSPRINTRADAYGGDIARRTRLLLDVVRRVRAATRPDFIVAVKLNASDFQKGGFTVAESVEVAGLLESAGIDLLEVSGGNFESPKAYQANKDAATRHAREAYFLEHAARIKAALAIPVQVTGGIRSRAAMDAALAGGEADLFGLARPFIVEPDFPAKLLDGRLDTAPAIERTLETETLPRGALLNWFCHQLWLCGTAGAPDLSLSVKEGHDRYVANMTPAPHA